MLDGEPRAGCQRVGQPASAPDKDALNANGLWIGCAKNLSEVRYASAVTKVGGVDSKDHGAGSQNIVDSDSVTCAG